MWGIVPAFLLCLHSIIVTLRSFRQATPQLPSSRRAPYLLRPVCTMQSPSNRCPIFLCRAMCRDWSPVPLFHAGMPWIPAVHCAAPQPYLPYHAFCSVHPAMLLHQFAPAPVHRLFRCPSVSLVLHLRALLTLLRVYCSTVS